MVYFRAANPGVCTYMDDSRTGGAPLLAPPRPPASLPPAHAAPALQATPSRPAGHPHLPQSNFPAPAGTGVHSRRTAEHSLTTSPSLTRPPAPQCCRTARAGTICATTAR